MAAILETIGVGRSFGGLRAVDDVSFAVQEGEVLSIIGPNGAGKTTLFNLITGALQPDTGEVHFMGRSLKGLGPHQTAQLGIGRTFQIVKPFLGLTVHQNVALAALARAKTRTEADRKADEVLDLTGLKQLRNLDAKSLTLAMRKRLEVARAMALQPKIILLDEVMAGLNPTEVDETVKLVKNLKHLGIGAVAGVEHVMRAVMSISDRVVVLAFGKKIAEGTPAEVVQNSEVIKAYLGTSYSQTLADNPHAKEGA